MQAKFNPYTNRLLDTVQQQSLPACHYLGCLSNTNDSVSRVTFSGVTDANSWLNNWPVKGRMAYPLLFDRDGGFRTGVRCRHQNFKGK